jgi:CRISP-associated protein Cas1
VRGSRLVVNGKAEFETKTEKFDSVIIDTRRGFLTFEALFWLSNQNKAVFFLDWKGRLQMQFSPSALKAGTWLKIRQVEAATNPERRSIIAQAFVRAKIENQERLLHDLGFKSRLHEREEVAARAYWEYLKPFFNRNGFHFTSRGTFTRAHASDPMNSTLNYGYSILEALCRRVLVTRGFLTEIGFLHKVAILKEPLVYDFQELGRTDIDRVVLDMVRERELKPSLFRRAWDYTMYLDPHDEGRKMLVKRIQSIPRLENRIIDAARALERHLLNRGKSLKFPSTKSAPSESLDWIKPGVKFFDRRRLA